ARPAAGTGGQGRRLAGGEVGARTHREQPPRRLRVREFRWLQVAGRVARRGGWLVGRQPGAERAGNAGAAAGAAHRLRHGGGDQPDGGAGGRTLRGTPRRVRRPRPEPARHRRSGRRGWQGSLSVSMQTLTLAVLGRQAAQFGSRSRKVFPEAGGSIGRSEDCEWVLGAPGVSRIHAMVRYLNGIYFIEDRSTNGMLLNGAPLPRGEPSALKDGDRLQIDTFEISVQVQAPGQAAEAPAAPAPAMAPAPLPGDPLDFGLSDLPAPAAAAASASLIPDAAVAGGDLDPLSFLDAPYATPVAEPAPPQPAPIPSWNHTAGSADHFRPPVTDVQRQAQVLPENWDLTMGDFAP